MALPPRSEFSQYLLFFLPISVFAGGVFFFDLINSCDNREHWGYLDEGLRPSANLHTVISEYNRYKFAFVSINAALYVICFTSIFYCFKTIREFSNKKWIIVLSVISFSMSLFFILSQNNYSFSCTLRVYYGFPLDAIKAIWTRYAGVLSDAEFIPASMLAGVILTNAAWYSTCAFAPLLCLRPNEADGDKAAEVLALRLSHLRNALYLTAAVLVLGTLALQTWLLWPARMIGLHVSNLENTGSAEGLGLYYGTIMTLVLASLYLPAELILCREVRQLASRMEPSTRKEWLANHGIAAEAEAGVLAPRLFRVAALIAPMLAGPLGGFLGTISG